MISERYNNRMLVSRGTTPRVVEDTKKIWAKKISKYKFSIWSRARTQATSLPFWGLLNNNNGLHISCSPFLISITLGDIYPWSMCIYYTLRKIKPMLPCSKGGFNVENSLKRDQKTKKLVGHD